jgi:hypothetical protein
MYHCTISEALILTVLLVNKGYPVWDALKISFSLHCIHNKLVQAGYSPENIRTVLEEL